MTPETVMTVARSAIELMLYVAGPLLIAALATGLIISVFQAATQINEMMARGMVRQLIDFTRNLLGNLPWMIG